MKDYKKTIFIVIVIFQSIVVIILFHEIKLISNNTLGISINRIDSNKIKYNIDSKLEYFYEPVPNSTFEEVKTWVPYKVKYTINSDSLNERFEYKIQKDQGVFRIIAIGDSFTYGLYVSTINNFVKLLEDKLNSENRCNIIEKYEVINLGMEGYDTQYEVERYRIRGKKYNPDLVIWYITDPYRLTEKIREIQKTLPTDTPGNFYGSWEVAYKRINNLYSDMELFNFQIEKIKEFRLKYYNGPLLILAKKQFIDLLKNKFTGKNIYFGLTENMENKSKYRLPDSHFNEDGHRQMTEEILRELKGNKLMPCD